LLRSAPCGKCSIKPGCRSRTSTSSELNEAFAAQMLGCDKELQLDEDRVNVHGGGHRAGAPDRGVGGAGAGDAAVRAGAAGAVKRGLASLCLGAATRWRWWVEKE